MREYKMKTLLTVLLCLSLATAQQIPNKIEPKSNARLELKTALKKWHEKLKQYHSPESRKSQEYVKLRREMREELQEIRQGKTLSSTPVLQESVKQGTNETKAVPSFANRSKNISQVDTSRQYEFSLTPVPTEHNETTSYDIPYASKGNTIELSVVNNSSLATEDVRVEVTNAPDWLKFGEKQVSLQKLEAKEEKPASFVFTVEKSAVVNKEQTLNFAITEKNGQRWTKDITIKVSAPETYQLFQNYPNPFNPTTVISFSVPSVVGRDRVSNGVRDGQLLANSYISLKIYDVLGREVANLIDEQRPAGYHQATFDAHRYASGMYIYQLIATDEQSNPHIFRKTMLLVK